MMRKWIVANAIVWLAAALVCCAPPRASAQDQQTSKTPYTLPEYNAYQAAAGQTDPQAKIQALDDFVTKFPNSALMPLVYQQYYNAYSQSKNYPKLIEYVDKFLAVPADKYLAIPGMSKERLAGDRVQALYFRAVAFNQSFNEKDANAAQELTDARKYALQGLDALGQIAKPANLTDAQFAEQKKQPTMVFNYTAARAALLAKDYKDAIDSYNAYIAASGGPSQSVASVYYQIGVAYLQMVAQQMASQPQTNTQPNGQPPATSAANAPGTSTTTPPATPATGAAAGSADNPQLTGWYMDGFWNLAKALSLNVPGAPQVKSYLRAQMFNYEQPACGNLLDDQMNALIQQAGTQTARPATYSLPSAADLGKILQSSNLLSILSDLQGGGDKATMTWLAVCGQEIPNVVGKIIDITPATDSIEFKVFTAATGEEIQAGTTPNLDVTVYTSTPSAADTAAAAGGGANAQAQQTPPPVQPEVARFQKGDGIKFTGTLTKYDRQPFLLYFSKVTVDESTIPKEKTPARRPRRPGVR